MTMVETTRQSGWQQKNNNGKYGFFPTPLEIVEMEMNLIDFSEVSKDNVITLADFTGGEGEQLHHMHQFLLKKELKPISFYNEITQKRYETALRKYGEIENFHLLNTDFFFIRCRYKDGNKQKKDTIAIIRNNPPYTWMQHRGENVRSEDVFFLENAPYNINGGIHIFELPLHQLIEQNHLLKKICYRYENISIFKFPEEIFKKFKQVVVIGTKKAFYSNDGDLADKWKEKCVKNELISLEKVNSPVCKLTNKTLAKVKIPNIFRDGRVNELTLTKGLEQVLDNLIEKEKGKNSLKKHQIILESKPIIERTIGHRAVELNSGKFNGIIKNVLIEGGSRKTIEVVVIEEEDKTIKEEIEKITPYIEITNARGDIIFKDY